MSRCYEVKFKERYPISVEFIEYCPIERVRALLTSTGRVIVTSTGHYLTLSNGSDEYETLEQLGDLFHKIVYGELDYEYAYQFFKDRTAPTDPTACSSIRLGNYFGRNLDWYRPEEGENGQPDFAVVSPGLGDIERVIGIASYRGIEERMAVAHTPTEAWKILPFYMQDGINSKGVFANINVVPTDKGNNTYSVPTIEKRDEVCSVMLVRYILDHFGSAREACEYIQQYVSVYMPTALTAMGYDSHYMIGDETETFVLEIVDNEVVYHEHNIMTNFHIDGVEFLESGKIYTNADAAEGNEPTSLGITPYGSGLERYNMLVDASTDDTLTMRDIMNSILYSKAYDLTTDPYWYSEFVSADPRHIVTVDTLPTAENMKTMVDAAQAIKDGEIRGRLWMTTHSCVYNIAERTIEVVNHEDLTKSYTIN